MSVVWAECSNSGHATMFIVPHIAVVTGAPYHNINRWLNTKNIGIENTRFLHAAQNFGLKFFFFPIIRDNRIVAPTPLMYPLLRIYCLLLHLLYRFKDKINIISIRKLKINIKKHFQTDTVVVVQFPLWALGWVDIGFRLEIWLGFTETPIKLKKITLKIQYFA